MVANGGISHNGNLSSEVSADWRKLGENVAYGTDFETVMNQFINSSGHYNNIVDPAFNYIGVGVSYDASGQMFTTHDFMSMDGGSPSPEPAPAPTPRAAPAPRARVPAPEPEPEPAPEPPPPPAPPPTTPARMHTMLAALRTFEVPAAACRAALSRGCPPGCGRRPSRIRGPGRQRGSGAGPTTTRQRRTRHSLTRPLMT